MTKNRANTALDTYFDKAKMWKEEISALRTIMLECGLTEELKWAKPCYSMEDKNVVIIQGFKEYCALLFFKGMLMKDPDGILVKTGVNTRVGRQIRFHDVSEIVKMRGKIKASIHEAIAVEKSGIKVEAKEEKEIVFPDELEKKFKELPALKKAFFSLTPGRQKGYVFYFSGAKQSKTRILRIEKCMQQILDGKGLNDE